jgi:hypothetical protein
MALLSGSCENLTMFLQSAARFKNSSGDAGYAACSCILVSASLQRKQ